MESIVIGAERWWIQVRWGRAAVTTATTGSKDKQCENRQVLHLVSPLAINVYQLSWRNTNDMGSTKTVETLMEA